MRLHVAIRDMDKDITLHSSPAYWPGALAGQLDIPDDAASGVCIRQMYAEHRGEAFAFLRKLNTDTRYARFWSPLEDYGLQAHLSRFDFSHAQMLGLFVESELVGLAEVAHGSGGAEIALVLAESAQGQKLGRHLLLAAACVARERGARKVYLHTSRENRAMQHAASAANFQRKSHEDGTWYAELELPEEDLHFPSMLVLNATP